MKTKKKQILIKGKIDKSFTEVNLTNFLKDNPNLIGNLRKKYSI